MVPPCRLSVEAAALDWSLAATFPLTRLICNSQMSISLFSVCERECV